MVVIDADRDEGEAFLQLASTSPTVVLAVTDDYRDQWQINLMELGADAVYAKPLAPDLMRARLNAAVRRQRRLSPRTPARYVFENLIVDLREPVVLVNGQQIHLSATEHKLVTMLAENAGRILSHDQLLREVWGEEYEGNDDLVRTFVSSLRKRLREAGFSHELIHTERSLGYWVVRLPVEMAKPRPGVSGRAVSVEAQLTRLAVREQRERLRAEMSRLQGSVERLQEAASKRAEPDRPARQPNPPPRDEMSAS